MALLWLLLNPSLLILYFFQLPLHQREQVKQGACQAAPNPSLLKRQRQFLLSKKELPLQEAFWIWILVSVDLQKSQYVIAG